MGEKTGMRETEKNQSMQEVKFGDNRQFIERRRAKEREGQVDSPKIESTKN